MKTSDKVAVYTETGKKRTFAGAIDWPGWCRSGRDEESALQALLEYSPRYARVIRAARFEFRGPAGVSGLYVVERLAGDATTDFGAPGAAPSSDARPVDEAALARLQSVLKGCWRTFDKAVAAARGRQLRKGPRGGGREVAAIVEHVIGADASYLSRIGYKYAPDDSEDSALARCRKEILTGLAAAVREGVPERGPRGGTRWSPRYFVRRSAWHVLDHAWEIQDRTEA